LLDSHPDIRLAFDKRIKTSSSANRLQETKLSIGRHCTWLLDELRKRGYEERNDWPFNTASLGYYSVRRYIEKVLSSESKVLAAVTGGPELVRKLRTGDGTNRPVMKFLQRVEMDAHKLDGRFCVSIPNFDGDSTERIVYRLWVISLIDVASRVVIGYYFSIAKEVSADDVLRAIKASLTKWTPKKISFSKQPYSSGAGFLSSLGEEYIGLCWDETSVDGALAETCKRVETALRDAVGSILLSPNNSFAKRRSLDDRPYIEAFFRNLASGGFQRLSNTTGGKPEDRKGLNPEQVAITSRFQYEYAGELLDVLIANYNNSPHKGIGRRTPLAYARFLFENSQEPRRRAKLDTVESLLSVRKLCQVRGGAKVGRAAYVEFFNARYTNEILQNRQDLVSTKIWVVHHKEDDGRVALASTQDGTSLGVLRAAPPWHITPHSLALRRGILAAQSKGKFHIAPGGDGVDTFINFVEAQPHSKLPIHPTYLEARRIISKAADQFVGETVLQAAQEQFERRQDNPNSTASSVDTAPATTPARIPTSRTKPANTGVTQLPPRRIAATRGR
jgi:hypothetical protein